MRFFTAPNIAKRDTGDNANTAAANKVFASATLFIKLAEGDAPSDVLFWLGVAGNVVIAAEILEAFMMYFLK